jgi:hypothetical protein
VTALDVDHKLLEALSARAGALEVEVVCADARRFELGRSDYGLCVVAMQTVQLLGGEAGRAEFLRRVRAHLRPGGVLACAIVSEFESFDCRRGGEGPPGEIVRVGGIEYVSRPIRVSTDKQRVLIERARKIVSEGRAQPREGSHRLPRPGSRALTSARERDVIELDVLTVEQLEREGIAAGLGAGAARRVEADDEYLGSDVVVLHG